MNEYEVIKKIFYPLSFKKEFSLDLDDDAGLLPKTNCSRDRFYC